MAGIGLVQTRRQLDQGGRDVYRPGNPAVSVVSATDELARCLA